MWIMTEGNDGARAAPRAGSLRWSNYIKRASTDPLRVSHASDDWHNMAELRAAT